jgi:hypothetical protein
MSTKSYETNIFDLLRNVDRGDYSQWSKMSEVQKKEFSPLLTMKWMSGTNDIRQIIFLNTLANPMVFPLSKHPELLMKLLTVCSSKCGQKYVFPKGAKSVASSKALTVVKEYFEYSTRAAKESMALLSNEQIVEMAVELGYQKDELTALKNELKTRQP